MTRDDVLQEVIRAYEEATGSSVDDPAEYIIDDRDVAGAVKDAVQEKFGMCIWVHDYESIQEYADRVAEKLGIGAGE